jgi:hypothetical protein
LDCPKYAIISQANTAACTNATNNSKNQKGRDSILPASHKLKKFEDNAHKYHITQTKIIPANILPKSLNDKDARVEGIHIK